MVLLANLVKMNLPGSTGFLWIGLVIGVFLLFGSSTSRKGGRTLLAVLAVFYLFLATPVVAGLLEAGLDHGYGWIESPEQVDDVQAIVVLGGGSITYQARGEVLNALSEQSSLRVLEGARLYKLLDNPKVIVSGGVSQEPGRVTPESLALRDGLIMLGVPAEMILLESEAGNTQEHPLKLEEILGLHGVTRFILVTSPPHMYRAMEVFQAAGMDPVPSVGVWHSDELQNPTIGWRPNSRSLYASQVAIREYLALGYYRLQGWLPSL
ncbi:MAG: YdcF family protein [Anaerolineales bacterium]|nr:YdcF family protein [Anaerolineales bacterium]